MRLFMYTHTEVKDYLFKAEDENQAEQIMGLIKAVDDEELRKQICESNKGHMQIDVAETLLSEYDEEEE
tara:strand:- start:154 stop:360 length:207 start_codon:yes stop_codon:yes gene_type:complete